MKKYEKPAIEVVEANLSADCMQLGTSTGEGYQGEQLAPGKKGAPEDEDDGFSEGW